MIRAAPELGQTETRRGVILLLIFVVLLLKLVSRLTEGHDDVRRGEYLQALVPLGRKKGIVPLLRIRRLHGAQRDEQSAQHGKAQQLDSTI